MGDPKLVDVADAAGISYRMADYWHRSGFIDTYLDAHPEREVKWPGKNGPRKPLTAQSYGSGYVRHLTPHEAHVLHMLADLVHAGWKAGDAAPVARRLVECPQVPVRFGSVVVGVVADGC